MNVAIIGDKKKYEQIMVNFLYDIKKSEIKIFDYNSFNDFFEKAKFMPFELIFMRVAGEEDIKTIKQLYPIANLVLIIEKNIPKIKKEELIKLGVYNIIIENMFENSEETIKNLIKYEALKYSKFLALIS